MALKTSVGTSDFREYRTGGAHYVDKTAFLKDFLPRHPAVSLFTRPRRFGKSMTLSMMARFLDVRERELEGPDIFEGLEVTKGEDGETVCAEWMHRRPVVLLSLKGIESSNSEDAPNDLKTRVRALCGRHDHLRRSPNVSRAFRLMLDDLVCRRASIGVLKGSLHALCAALAEHHGRKTVVLVDECDAPVAKSRQRGHCEDMTVFLSGMLEAALKDNEFLDFGVVTGSMRAVGESRFIVPNNVISHGISQGTYSDVFGFTSTEVTGLLEAAGLSHREREIRERCDCRRFGDSRDMYSPWDVMSRIEELQANSAAVHER